MHSTKNEYAKMKKYPEKSVTLDFITYLEPSYFYDKRPTLFIVDHRIKNPDKEISWHSIAVEP